MDKVYSQLIELSEKENHHSLSSNLSKFINSKFALIESLLSTYSMIELCNKISEDTGIEINYKSFNKSYLRVVKNKRVSNEDREMVFTKRLQENNAESKQLSEAIHQKPLVIDDSKKSDSKNDLKSQNISQSTQLLIDKLRSIGAVENIELVIENKVTLEWMHEKVPAFKNGSVTGYVLNKDIRNVLIREFVNKPAINYD